MFSRKVKNNVFYDHFHSRFRTQNFLHGGPLLTQCSLLPFVQCCGFSIKPFIYLFALNKGLRYVPGLIDKVKNNAVFDTFAEFVCVNIIAKNFLTLLDIRFQQRCTRKTNKNRIWQHRFHRAMKFSTLGSMTFINQNKQITDNIDRVLLEISNKRIKVIHTLTTKLMNQRTQQSVRRFSQTCHQTRTTTRTQNLLPGQKKEILNLLIKFNSVGKHQHTSIRFVFKNPLCEQNHHNALTAALGMPDDSALKFVHMLLSGLDTKILVNTWQLLLARLKQNKIINKLKQTRFVTHFEKVLIEFVPRVILFVFFPLHEKLLFCSYSAIVQTFGVVTCENKLNSAKKPFIKLRLLIR